MYGKHWRNLYSYKSVFPSICKNWLSRRKFGFDSDEVIDVVNLKLPIEMFGSFGAADGVYPAYHMNKLHWISVLLPDAPDDVVQFLVNVSFEAPKNKRKGKIK